MTSKTLTGARVHPVAEMLGESNEAAGITHIALDTGGEGGAQEPTGRPNESHDPYDTKTLTPSGFPPIEPPLLTDLLPPPRALGDRLWRAEVPSPVPIA